MLQDPATRARNADRHSHIGVRLQYHANGKWEHLEALGWNEVGFNFYHAQDIAAPLLALKRGLTHFDGNIVWRALNTSDEVVLATLVNELIFKRAQAVVNDAALHARLVKLIRVPGMVPEKRKILASLGQDAGDANMADMIRQRRLERPMFHYGVKVQSDAWTAIIHQALSLSSVVISLEKWSQALAKP